MQHVRSAAIREDSDPFEGFACFHDEDLWFTPPNKNHARFRTYVHDGIATWRSAVRERRRDIGVREESEPHSNSVVVRCDDLISKGTLISPQADDQPTVICPADFREPSSSTSQDVGRLPPTRWSLDSSRIASTTPSAPLALRHLSGAGMGGEVRSLQAPSRPYRRVGRLPGDRTPEAVSRHQHTRRGGMGRATGPTPGWS